MIGGIIVGVVRKADFYYGSMLSCLINNGLAPAIIERGDSRRRYSLVTNKGEYNIYAKYVSAPIKRQNKDTQLWQFIFSREEVEDIKNYEENENGKKLYFVLICGREKLQDSEIAILSLDEAKDCLDIDYERENYRITIKWEKACPPLPAERSADGICGSVADLSDPQFRALETGVCIPRIGVRDIPRSRHAFLTIPQCFLQLQYTLNTDKQLCPPLSSAFPP